ncbi:ketopantoate reductase [Kribbella antibiotica]|uniref:Ketopantoate reductase n=1 Tax=Kribbella antibiotica TaxID=190195 RepID=A0A4R4ZPS5_9ACTN|nr:2-dehydropantoate 2-reductase N-terminal domain-containing protein [Kribbella antibiotica]TDD60270.1 ketopantoate reductase [Kribbella antibiotica]
MKVLMFGRGVIATIYGWTLAQAGHDVEFYVRPGRAATYGDTISLDLLDTRHKIRGERILETWPVRYREDLEPDHDFDLIVLSVAHYQLPEATTFLAPRVGNATVLVFGNIWADPLTAIGDLPIDQIAWGFPQAGGGFGPDDTLRGALLRSVIFGTIDRPLTNRELAVRRTFREAGLRINEKTNLRGWLWIHFVSDTGLFAQAVRIGSLADLAGSPKELRQAILTARELLPLLEARGVDLREHRANLLQFRLPAWLTSSLLAALTKHIALIRMSFEAHSDPHAQEPREVCRDTLTEARRLGIPTPHLEAAEPHFAHDRIRQR